MSGPFPMPNAHAVPIVGQPLTLHQWFPTVAITCNCEAKTHLLLVGLGPVFVCGACRRGFRLLAVAQDARTGQPPNFHIDIVLQPQMAETGAAGAGNGKPS